MHAQKNEPRAMWSGLLYYMDKHSEGTEYSIIVGGGGSRKWVGNTWNGGTTLFLTKYG